MHLDFQVCVSLSTSLLQYFHILIYFLCTLELVKKFVWWWWWVDFSVFVWSKPGPWPWTLTGTKPDKNLG